MDGQQISFEVDTGACATIMSIGEYKNKLKNKNIVEVSNKLLTVTGEPINAWGKTKVEVVFDGRVYHLEIIVIQKLWWII